MSEHARQLIGRVRQRKQSARHINVSTGKRKSVRHRLVHDVKLKIVLPIGDLTDNLLPDVVHVGGKRRIVIEPVVRLQLLRCLQANLPVPLRRVAHPLVTTASNAQRNVNLSKDCFIVFTRR